MRLEIWNDCDVENPCENAGSWKIYSFCRNHINSVNPDKFLTDNGNWRFEYARKVNLGLVFPLSYFEHGNCVWSIKGSGPQCQWDNTEFAGVAVWEEPASNMGAKDYQTRAKDLSRFLEEYTKWCNGECYGWTVLDDNGQIIDSCGGYIGQDYILEEIRREYPELVEVSINHKEQIP